MAIDIRLYVDGQRIADGSAGEPSDTPYALEGLLISWGRATTVDQPSASTCSFTVYARQGWVGSGLFADAFKIGRRVDVDAGWMVHNEWTKQGRAFTGVITDVSMSSPADDPFALLIMVTADDLLADLANRPAASTPWPKETVSARINHVLTAARVNTGCQIATDLATIQLRKTDNDTGSAADMLQNIAVSTDGIMWAIAGLSEPSLWLESPAGRAPLRRLAYVAPWVVIVDVSPAAGALQIGSCIPDLSPLEWRQTMSDLTTSVEVKYYTPDPGDSTAPDIDNIVLVVAAGAESPSKPWGVRRAEIDSLLTTSADSSITATKVLTRLSTPTWRVDGVTVSATDMADLDMIRLVDSLKRTGLPVQISPLPAWAPAGGFTGYLEGGELVFQVGHWTAQLWLANATGYAGISARYIDIPQTDNNWQYQDVHPSIRYQDLIGVGGPA